MRLLVKKTRRHLNWPLTLQFWLNVIVAIVLFEMVVVLLSSLGIHIPQWIYANIKTLALNWPFDIFYDASDGVDIDEPADSFLTRYEKFCQQSLVPNQENIQLIYNRTRFLNSSALCACVPADLIGGFVINVTSTPLLDAIVMMHPELAPGGTWMSHTCIPRQRIAVIIPFRDREEHLKSLLYVLHPFLQRQQLDYTIFVVEQAEPEIFNKAMLMNIGFREASRMGAFDCYIFHDVDMLPEDDHNFYVCSVWPRHVGAFVDKWQYKIPYSGLFGGVTAFTKAQFELINGFSNQYYGWGGEDDDMFKRLRAKNLKITRFPRSVARFNMIKHEPDERNPYNIKSELGYRYRPDHYITDGLNSLNYTKRSAELRPLYYWLSVSLPQPKNFKGHRRSYGSGGCNHTIQSIVTKACTFFFAILSFLHIFLSSIVR